MGLVVLEIISFRGVWTLVQSALHFNYTKLLTVYLALRSAFLEPACAGQNRRYGSCVAVGGYVLAVIKARITF